jgi:hypothetical protein
MTNTVLKAQIDSQITNETTPNGIAPTEVGVNIKAVVDYVDQEVSLISPSSPVYIAKLTQTGGAGVTAVVIKNTLDAITVSYSTQGVGTYGISPSDLGNYVCLISNTSLTRTVKAPMNFSGFSGVFTQSDLAGALVANFNDVYIQLSPL